MELARSAAPGLRKMYRVSVGRAVLGATRVDGRVAERHDHHNTAGDGPRALVALMVEAVNMMSRNQDAVVWRQLFAHL